MNLTNCDIEWQKSPTILSKFCERLAHLRCNQTERHLPDCAFFHFPCAGKRPNNEVYCVFCRISVIFRVKSAKAVKITDMDLIKRLGLIVGIFVLCLLIRTLVSPPVVIVGKLLFTIAKYLGVGLSQFHCDTHPVSC